MSMTKTGVVTSLDITEHRGKTFFWVDVNFGISGTAVLVPEGLYRLLDNVPKPDLINKSITVFFDGEINSIGFVLQLDGFQITVGITD